jgi:CRP-like cAMP-binding protein
MIASEYCLHAANVLRVVSFSAKDILWLRLFSIVASFISIPYFYMQAVILWEPIIWTLVFAAINGYHVWRLWLQRRPVKLSPDEATLYDLTFFPLSPRQFLQLVRLGQWNDLNAGEVLIRPGTPIHEIVVPLTESVEARIGERSLGRFSAGAIVGASALYNTRLEHLKVVVSEGCRVLRLPVGAIKQRTETDVQLARILDRIAREDLTRKLEHLVKLAEIGIPAGQSNPPT